METARLDVGVSMVLQKDGGIGAVQNANLLKVADPQQKAELFPALVNSLLKHAAELCSACVNVMIRLVVVLILEKALLLETYTIQNYIVKSILSDITMSMLA